jgi:bacterioferritin
MKLEEEGIANYRAGIKDCEDAGDYVTRDLFLQILKDEEGHEDHIQTQLKMIETMGLEKYIQLNSDALDAAE